MAFPQALNHAVKGAPFTVENSTTVTNTFLLRIVNRTDQTQAYRFRVVDAEEVTLEFMDSEAVELKPGERTEAT